MRIYQTTGVTRDARGDITQTKGAPVSCLHFRLGRYLVTRGRALLNSGPGEDDMADADLVSADILKIGQLLMFDYDDHIDVYRILDVSYSTIGRNQYKLTEKLDNAS